jgi:hypothetical protein
VEERQPLRSCYSSLNVQCDEKHPNCTNCVRYGSKCEYRLFRKVSESYGSTPVLNGLDTPSSPQNPALSIDTNTNQSHDMALNIPQLRLLHHFTNNTSKTLAYEPEAVEVFSSHFIKVSFENPYLLHAILAISALHLSRLESDSRSIFLVQAERHHHAALTRFMSEVSDINGSNFQPVLAFSFVTFPYSWAISTDGGTSMDHAFDSILSSVVLTRRVRPIVQNPALFHAITTSELGCMIPKDIHVVDWHASESPAETELVQLRKFAEVIHHVYPPDIIEAYKSAIHLLELLFSRTATSTNPPSDAVLKQWVHHVSVRFIELLSEKQPGALIIFAHYGVVLGRSLHYWYFEGVDALILRVAEHFVPTEWASWLDWPKQQIRREMALLVTKT